MLKESSKIVSRCMTTFIHLVLSAALLLSISCASSAVGMESRPRVPCLVIENRTFTDAVNAVGLVNRDFFFAEMIKGGEKAEACSDDLNEFGPFIWCYQTEKDFQPICIQFTISDSQRKHLYNDDVDLWLTPKDQS